MHFFGIPLTLIWASVIVIGIRIFSTRKWIATNAIVTALGQPYTVSIEGKVHQTMIPVIRFRPFGGDEIIVEDAKLRLGPAIPGDVLTILYAPENPHRVVAASFSRRFRVEILFILVGLLLLVL